MTASLFKSPWFFSIFWPILTMQRFGRSPLVLLFPILQSLYQSSGDCTKSTSYNWHHRHFHVLQFLFFFQFHCKVQTLIFLFASFQFLSVVCRDNSVHNSASSIFCGWLLLGLVVRPRLGLSKSHRCLFVLFSRTYSWLCIYHYFICSNFSFLHNSQWITLPTQSCLVLNSFCDNLMHSLIMWLIILFLSPHSQHLLICCVLSIIVLIYDWSLWRIFVL